MLLKEEKKYCKIDVQKRRLLAVHLVGKAFIVNGEDIFILKSI